MILLMKQEKYKTDSKYGKEGSLKAVGKAKRTFAPKAVTQFKGQPESTAKTKAIKKQIR